MGNAREEEKTMADLPIFDPRVRRLASEVEKLLADDFCEFGTDGKVTHWLEESILPGNRDSVGLVSWHVRMEL